MNKAQKQATQAQLNREKQTIKELKQIYQQALKDCEKKISELSARTDMENLQSIIYQKQYQEALKAQLEGILSNLQSNSYATVSDYLTKCYRDGYTGVMYDLQKTGIPIIMPIDQAAVVRAIQTDSKLSKSLYDKMGEDVTYLKKAVRAEVSRGIANGSTWNEVAGKLSRHMANTPFQKAYNNSIRIARTEGHRIQVQSALDAQHVAKSKGADIVKQWDATLDGATREHHQMLDGQIREVDEPFEVANLKVEAPGMFGLASEDCNCRCCLLQRARWALDDEELQTLKDRAAYFDLDKAKEFEEYQEKYLGITQEDIQKYEKTNPLIPIDNIKDNDKIEDINKQIAELKKQFSDSTDGYSYYDWFKEFTSIEDGYGEDDDVSETLKKIDEQIRKLSKEKSDLLLSKERRNQIETGYKGKIPDDKLAEYNAKAYKQIKSDTGYSDEDVKTLHDAFMNYFGGDYETISTGENPTALIIRNGLDRMPVYDGEIYRGMIFSKEDSAKFKNLKPGDTVPSKGIIESWSSEPRVAMGFSGVNSYERDSVILECVDNKTAVGVQHISKFGTREAEVMSSAEYEVVEVVTESKYDYLSKHPEQLWFEDDLYDEKVAMENSTVCIIKVKEKN